MAKFFDRLELQFVNILQMRKLREGRGFDIDERIIAAHLVALCEGQFMRYVRSNFRHSPNQGFNQHGSLLKAYLHNLFI